jgi:hypothetical protein
MADFGVALGLIGEATEATEEAQVDQISVRTDCDASISVIGDIPQTLNDLYAVIDRERGNIRAVLQAAEHAMGKVKEADETGHFTESENAQQQLEHLKELAQGQDAVLDETKEALDIVLTRLDEVKLSFESIRSTATEADSTCGATLQNLEQLMTRMSS